MNSDLIHSMLKRAGMPVTAVDVTFELLRARWRIRICTSDSEPVTLYVHASDLSDSADLDALIMTKLESIRSEKGLQRTSASNRGPNSNTEGVRYTLGDERAIATMLRRVGIHVRAFQQYYNHLRVQYKTTVTFHDHPPLEIEESYQNVRTAENHMLAIYNRILEHCGAHADQRETRDWLDEHSLQMQLPPLPTAESKAEEEKPSDRRKKRYADWKAKQAAEKRAKLGRVRDLGID